MTMGEAKRKREREAMAQITQGLADSGQLVQAGWATYAGLAGRDPVSDFAGREAFFAGASYLFESAIMAMLEPGTEETPGDMARMDALHQELRQFDAWLRLKHDKTVRHPPPTAAEEFAELGQQQRLGDAPVEAAYAGAMRAAAMGIDALFNGDAKGADRETGFVLMVFPYGDHSGRCNYMSNGADRRDVLVLMKEMVARFSGQADVSGRA
jgi:hypothetical protein